MRIERILSTTDTRVSTLEGQVPGLVPFTGGTMTGQLVAQSNTNYTTAQVRNIIISTEEPSAGVGNNGDIWIQYFE